MAALLTALAVLGVVLAIGNAPPYWRAFALLGMAWLIASIVLAVLRFWPKRNTDE